MTRSKRRRGQAVPVRSCAGVAWHGARRRDDRQPRALRRLPGRRIEPVECRIGVRRSGVSGLPRSLRGARCRCRWRHGPLSWREQRVRAPLCRRSPARLHLVARGEIAVHAAHAGRKAAPALRHREISVCGASRVGRACSQHHAARSRVIPTHSGSRGEEAGAQAERRDAQQRIPEGRPGVAVQVSGTRGSSTAAAERGRCMETNEQPDDIRSAIVTASNSRRAGSPGRMRELVMASPEPDFYRLASRTGRSSHEP